MFPFCSVGNLERGLSKSEGKNSRILSWPSMVHKWRTLHLSLRQDSGCQVIIVVNEK